MTGFGHMTIGGSLTFLILSNIENVTSTQFALGMGIGVFSSILPDIDAENSVLQVFIDQNGKSKLVDEFFSYRSKRSILGGLLYELLSITEIGIRYFIKSSIDLFKTFFSHRTLTHYLLTPVFVSLFFVSISIILKVSFIYTLAFFVGYLSHLIGDSMTTSGLRLFEPIYGKKIHLLPAKLRIRMVKGISVREVFYILFVLGFVFIFSL